MNDRRGIDVRATRPDELDATLEVWRAASVARGGITYVAVDPAIAGMARVETIGADRALISMVFVHPSRQRHGVGTALLGHVFDVCRSRVGRVCRP